MIAIKNLLKASSVLTNPLLMRSLVYVPTYNVAFMQLFEKHKRPAELHPIFKRVVKEKGHLKSKGRKIYSKKLNTKVKTQKQRLKNHKGLLKRVKIVSVLLDRLVQDGTESLSSSHREHAI